MVTLLLRKNERFAAVVATIASTPQGLALHKVELRAVAFLLYVVP